MSDEIKFDPQRWQKLLADHEAKKPDPPKPPDFSEFATSIPKEEDVSGDLPEHVRTVNDAVNSITAFEVYDRLVRKERQNPGNRTESVMASCPAPDHPDRNPSAWFGLVKGTWIVYCIKCERAWNATQIASMVWGLESDDDFWMVKTRMAEEFRNIRVVDSLAGPETVSLEPSSGELDKSDNTEQTGHSQTKPAEDQPAQILSIVPEPQDEDPQDALQVYPTIDWKNIVPEDTFLWEYMARCVADDAPEEYHFWHGLIAVGHALGRRTVLFDQPNVLGNLYVCLLGGTGYGKSRSRTHLHKVVRGALPFKDNGLETEGVRLQGSMASGEALLDAFHHEAKDPSLPRTGVLTSINGLVEYDELSMLANLALRSGNILKPVIISFYDGVENTQRTRTGGSKTAHNPFCSMTASTQPKAVRGILDTTDAASGFLNRWIFAGGPAKPPTIFALPGTEIDYTDAIDLLGDLRRWSLTKGKGALHLTEDARRLATDFFRTTVLPARDSDQSDLLKRLDLLFKKLMLLVGANSHEEKISADTVERITELFEYLITCYGIIDSEIGITKMQEVIQHVQIVIEKQTARLGKGLTVRQMMDFTNNKYGLEDINKAVRQLLLAGILEEDPTPKGPGRKTKRYSYAS